MNITQTKEPLNKNKVSVAEQQCLVNSTSVTTSALENTVLCFMLQCQVGSPVNEPE